MTMKALNSGHTACAGCGELLAMRHVLEAAGPNIIVIEATGCGEVTTSAYPNSAFGVPWIHSVFANAPSVASGVLAALKAKGDTKTKVIVLGGDGASYDIGFGALSGMWARGEDILYVSLDNEAYMNTGIQASGATMPGASTTTSPAGKVIPGNEANRKDMLSIALAHSCVYVASSSSAHQLDIQAKVKKALSIEGPKYLQIMTPCVPGWGIEPNETIRVAELGHAVGLYPIIEVINGEITKTLKTPKDKPKITEYLKLQKRFKHILKNKKVLNRLQAIADDNIKKYNL